MSEVIDFLFIIMFWGGLGFMVTGGVTLAKRSLRRSGRLSGRAAIMGAAVLEQDQRLSDEQRAQILESLADGEREATRKTAVEEAQERAEQNRVGNIIATGTMDVMNGWYTWATDGLDRENANRQRLTETTRERIRNGMDEGSAQASTWHEDTERRKQYVDNIGTLTSMVPDDTWTLDRLQNHGYRIMEAVRAAGDLENAHDYLCLICALIADKRDDVFPLELAPVTDRFAYSEDPNDRALYLQGRGLAVDQIIDSHTAARLHLDRIRAARESVKAANERHATALQGIRETYQPTHNRDQQADWDRQAQSIEGNPTP